MARTKREHARWMEWAVEQAWGYAKSASRPHKASEEHAERMFLTPGGVSLLRTCFAAGDSIKVLLKPLLTAEDYKKEMDAFFRKEWHPGALWVEMKREDAERPVANLRLLVEGPEGWVAPSASRLVDTTETIRSALGEHGDLTDDFIYLLPLRAAAQWPEEWGLGAATRPPELVDGQVRRGGLALLQRGGPWD